jgi:hypothetical protein
MVLPRLGARFAAPFARGKLALGLSVGLVGALAVTGCSDYDLVQFEGDDVFQQLEASQVDVLLVVDNSCSMQPYQNELADNFDNFLTYFQEGDVDYQLGVVTTAVSSSAQTSGCSAADVAAIPEGGKLVGDADGPTIITPATPNGEEVFAEIVDVGICGTGFEMGLESAYRALTPPFVNNYNGGFLREDAYLSVIFVSDEQDASPMGVNEYTNSFRGVKGQRDREVYNASAIVVTDIEECDAGQRQAGAEGTRYVDVARQSGGVIGSICAEDFSSIVSDLSLASSRLTDTFYLSRLPDVGTMRVFVDDGDCGGDEDDLEACEAECGGGSDYSWTFELHNEDGDRVNDPDNCDSDDNCRGAVVFDRSNLPPVKSRVNVLYNLGDGDPDDYCDGEDD